MKSCVYILCGLTGSGKTTYAQQLEREGALRLSVDEAVYERHGRYDVDYPHQSYKAFEASARAELDAKLEQLLTQGRSVILDYGFWARHDRDRYKQLAERHGATWRLLYFKVSKDELLQRLHKRNQRQDANALPINESMLNDFIARFEEPANEGEEIVTTPAPRGSA